MLGVKLACLAVCASGCVAIGLGAYPAAAVLAGTGVVAAGVNRGITGDCWASCRQGDYCDRKSGTCVHQACGGECRTDEACIDEVCKPRRHETQFPREELDGGTG
jgi:hypothetical protein